MQQAKGDAVQRIVNVLIAIDQLAYVLLTFGYGMPDETLSGAAWRTEQAGKLGGKIFRPLIDWLLWFDKDHCQNAHLWELRRAAYRSKSEALRRAQ